MARISQAVKYCSDHNLNTHTQDGAYKLYPSSLKCIN